MPSRRLTITLALVTGMSLSTVPAQAEPEDVATIADEQAALAQDLGTVAADEGLTSEEATARYGWQEDFVTFANHLQDTYPDEYAGAAVTDDGAAWVAFKGTPPTEAFARAAGVPVPVRVIADKGFSEAELNKTLTDTYYGIRARKDLVADTGGDYDVETGVVTIEVQPQAGLTAAARQQLKGDLQPASVPGSPIQVDVTVVDQVEQGTEAYIRGGGYLDLPEDRICTTAFTVKLRDGGYGVSTAEHCGRGRTLRYLNHGSSAYTTIKWKGGNENIFGDFAWYTRGSYTAARTYFWDYNKTRYVDQVKRPVKGIKIAHFGRTTGTKHSKVYKVNICSGDACGLTAMTKSGTKGGDSGGPWYWGGTAYGIHRGAKKMGGTWRAVFTPALALKETENPVYER
ncbi:hypothetical protein [Nonomuraea sp. NPDC049695]|uniref:hypothetical protein n=1 Tax=Nonomuraea sp. NPDC049695 TaxID=3154734 RepID=UPI0034498F48